jgi:hypothetical protein
VAVVALKETDDDGGSEDRHEENIQELRIAAKVGHDVSDA